MNVNLPANHPTVKKSVAAKQTADLKKAVQGLLNCPDLGLDELDPLSRKAITFARQALERAD